MRVAYTTRRMGSAPLGTREPEGEKRMDARPSTAPPSAVDVAIRIGVVVLALAAAIVHLSRLFPDPVFILNALGYLTLLAALYLPVRRLAPHRRVVRWALIGYAALTILAWVAIGERTPLGYSTTAGEVALVVLLLVEGRRARSRGEGGP